MSRRLAPLLASVLSLAACDRGRVASHPDVADSVTPRVPPRPAVARPAVEPRAEEGLRPTRCSPVRAPLTSPSWRLVGWRPGPRIEDIVAVGPRHRTLVATTRDSVCVSHDGGESWTAPFGEEPLAAPQVRALDALDAVALVAQGPEDAPVAPRVFLSRDDGAHWAALALPAGATASARVFTDRARTLYVASPTGLWTSVDGHGFEGPRALPGESADRVDACGETLIARALVGGDRFHHRSDDGGRTWRAFRLGVLGLEGNDVRVRCLGWRGGIEAGYDPLPRAWSFDGGRTWEPARYDALAQRAARARDDAGNPPAVLPRCTSTPTGARVCVDQGRAVLDAREIHAPAGCEHLRVVDDRRVVAFGPTCGIFVSHDLGGLWRPVASSLHAGDATPPGRGGFITRDVAWRVDGGVWWTEDGGAHWRLAPTVQGRTIERGVFVDRERGVFVRSDGWVVATRDGGRSWTFVMRGESARIASARAWVMVTTAERVRVSPDGGETWRAGATIPAAIPLDPVLVAGGATRRVELAPGVRVQQQGDRVELVTREGTSVIAQGLPRRFELLAAHAQGGAVDRVMLTDGVVLRRAQPSRVARN